MATKRRAIPKNLGAAADLYYTVRQERLAATKALAPLQEFESALRQHIIDTLPKSKLGGVAGKVIRCEIEKEKVPVIEDKKKFEAYVKRTGQFDLMTASLNAKAVRERWDAKKKVPGIGEFVVLKLRTNKLKK